MVGGEPRDAAETATLDQRTRASDQGGAYLLVVEQHSSRMVPLPHPGVVNIGRTSEAELFLDHSSVSRRHARLIIDRGVVRISDLDSHNGTRVNGQRLEGGRVLVTGDVVAIGEVILVLHAELLHELAPSVLDERTWRQRLHEEVERAVSFQRPLAVLAIANAPSGFPTGLRTIDVLGTCDDNLLALLPEATAEVAGQLAAALVHAHAGIQIGIASCPSDATDADSLVVAARAAVRVAAPGGSARIADAVERRVFGGREVLVCHPAMVRVYDLLLRLAASNLPVLILGETGVGKENAALAVHHHSARSGKPFLAVNCASFTDSIAETELFGHDKGAFTGADTARAGLLETASTGTLFLDEIGELSLPVQAKLLRALEGQRITRVGDHRERQIDVRIVAATNRVLEREVEAGRFRQDLYYRLGGARVHLLPLRERRCEIPILFRELVAIAARRDKRPPPVASPAVIQRLLEYRWPGNVRELKHVAEVVVATIEDDRIELTDLPPELAREADVPPSPKRPPGPTRRLADELEDLERTRMVEALATTGGVKTRAAALLGMPIRTFNLRVRQYGL
jgi:two-component system response regulator AtoC